MLLLRSLCSSVLLWSGLCRAVQQTPILPNADPGSTAIHFNYSSPAPHIFSAVRGLLQQVPNTLFPAGFSIVPCEIPAYTNLYHGRFDGELPPSPEWFGFDIEMSYGIMGSTRNSHMLTYQTTQPVKCLYFDGMSAALFDHHQLDSQMHFIWGNLTGPPLPRRPIGLYDEYARAAGLCDWVRDHGLGGLGWGVESFVRMNAGFELIWCNFSSPSVRLISHLNITTPLLPIPDDGGDAVRKMNDQETKSYFPLPSSTTSQGGHSTAPAVAPLPPTWRLLEYEPFLELQGWEWFRSATWHYGSTSSLGSGDGERRVKPLTCGFLSYYYGGFDSQELARVIEEQKSLNLSADGMWKGPGKEGNRTQALTTLMRRRRLHGLANLTASDARHMNERMTKVLRNLWFHGDNINWIKPNCTGLDWVALTNDLAQRYSESLQELLYLLADGLRSPHANHTETKQYLAQIRSRTHAFLFPFLEYPATAHNGTFRDDIWTLSSALGQETFSRCRQSYTRLLAEDQGRSLNHEESNIRWAVEETLGGICAVVINVGFSSEREWLRRYNSPKTDTSAHQKSLATEVDRWKRQVEELMAWLGWAGDWIECKEKCQWNEKCYIPMWPLINFGGRRRHRPPHYYSPRGPGYGPPRHPYDGAPGNGSRPVFRFPDFDEGLWEPKCVATMR